MSWQPPDPPQGQPFTAEQVEAAADLAHPPDALLAVALGDLVQRGLARAAARRKAAS